MKWQFWKRTKPPKRGRPAKSELERLANRVDNLTRRMKALTARMAEFSHTTLQVDPAKQPPIHPCAAAMSGIKETDNDEDEIASIIDREMHT